jgi:hypothetical protein
MPTLLLATPKLNLARNVGINHFGAVKMTIGSSLMVASACSLLILCCGVISGAEPKPEGKTSIVVSEGVGKDEKEARKAAFRDAVSKVVGNLVDAETVVKNDEVISEKILEFSGGFIKSYETLKTEKTSDGLIRVRIKATVERSQLTSKLKDAKIATMEVKGTDLLAEKLTKEEARQNASEFLAKLFEELPKIARAEVVGKPKLSDDGKGLNVEIVVRADVKAYADFVTKSTKLLDKIAIGKETHLFAAVPDKVLGFLFLPGTPKYFQLPELGQKTPNGFAVWLMTSADPAGTKTRWNLYWVDADRKTTLESITGTKQLKVEILDADQKPISEEQFDFYEEAQFHSWFLWGGFERKYRVDDEERKTTSFFIAPMDCMLSPFGGRASYSPRLFFRKKILLTEQELESVKTIKASVGLKLAPKAKD